MNVLSAHMPTVRYSLLTSERLPAALVLWLDSRCMPVQVELLSGTSAAMRVAGCILDVNGEFSGTDRVSYFIEQGRALRVTLAAYRAAAMADGAPELAADGFFPVVWQSQLALTCLPSAVPCAELDQEVARFWALTTGARTEYLEALKAGADQLRPWLAWELSSA